MWCGSQFCGGCIVCGEYIVCGGAWLVVGIGFWCGRGAGVFRSDLRV